MARLQMLRGELCCNELLVHNASARELYRRAIAGGTRAATQCSIALKGYAVELEAVVAARTPDGAGCSLAVGPRLEDDLMSKVRVRSPADADARGQVLARDWSMLLRRGVFTALWAAVAGVGMLASWSSWVSFVHHDRGWVFYRWLLLSSSGTGLASVALRWGWRRWLPSGLLLRPGAVREVKIPRACAAAD